MIKEKIRRKIFSISKGNNYATKKMKMNYQLCIRNHNDNFEKLTSFCTTILAERANHNFHEIMHEEKQVLQD